MAKKSTTPWNCQCEVGQRNRTLAEIAGAGEEVMKPALLLHRLLWTMQHIGHRAIGAGLRNYRIFL